MRSTKFDDALSLLLAKIRKEVHAWLNEGYAAAPADQRRYSNHTAKSARSCPERIYL